MPYDPNEYNDWLGQDEESPKPKVTVLPYMGKPEDPKRKDFVPLTVHTDGVIRKRARIIESEE